MASTGDGPEDLVASGETLLRTHFAPPAKVATDEEGGSDGTESGGQQCIVEANALTGRPWREALLYASEEESRAESLGRGQLAPRLPDASVPTMLLRGGSADPVEPSWDLSDRTDVKSRPIYSRKAICLCLVPGVV
jgi:hypothetical protein